MIVEYPTRQKSQWNTGQTDPERSSLKPILTLPHERQAAAPHRASVHVFEDPRSKALLERIRLIAPSGANAIVIGETGTGKELIASHIHSLSPRAKGPFVAVNCGAFSENLVESELFGHERGAFTGAISTKVGWFESANGGTLFLDEIGDLPLPMQVKLLRVLQEGEVVRVGSRKPISTDVRVVAATNVNLEEAVNQGRFREDLYYRLNVASLRLPPLRERPGDIPPLVEHFVRMYSSQLELARISVSQEAMELLVRGHSWPGNIRELENVIHHAILVRNGNVIRPEDLNLASLRSAVLAPPVAVIDPAGESDSEESLRTALVALLEKNEANLHDRIDSIVIGAAYDFCHRNQLETARVLGISRNVVRARLLKSGILAGKIRRNQGSRRGRYREGYHDGETLRERLFGTGRARLPDYHHGARYRDPRRLREPYEPLAVPAKPDTDLSMHEHRERVTSTRAAA